VRVDVFGNMFARRPGRDPDLPAVLVGSHLDSQPTGGKFDGAYGVLAALEVLRSFDDVGIETLRPVEVVNWTNEEGAIFKPMIGSEVFTGAMPLASGYAMPDPQGRTLEEDLRAIGYLGDTGLKPDPLHCYFEAHIEQGPILEREGAPIGVVTAGAGIRWYALTLTGFESHAGPTPMEVRRDALVGRRGGAGGARHRAQAGRGRARHRGLPGALSGLAQCHPRPGRVDGGFPPRLGRGAERHARGPAGRRCRDRQPATAPPT
jgi:beta-ureidopropionase / N-carbamoyl-L-amino-acid hydrolase